MFDWPFPGFLGWAESPPNELFGGQFKQAFYWSDAFPAIQLLTLSKHLTELIGTDSDSVKDIADGPCVLS